MSVLFVCNGVCRPHMVQCTSWTQPVFLLSRAMLFTWQFTSRFFVGFRVAAAAKNVFSTSLWPKYRGGRLRQLSHASYRGALAASGVGNRDEKLKTENGLWLFSEYKMIVVSTCLYDKTTSIKYSVTVYGPKNRRENILSRSFSNLLVELNIFWGNGSSTQSDNRRGWDAVYHLILRGTIYVLESKQHGPREIASASQTKHQKTKTESDQLTYYAPCKYEGKSMQLSGFSNLLFSLIVASQHRSPCLSGSFFACFGRVESKTLFYLRDCGVLCLLSLHVMAIRHVRHVVRNKSVGE